MTKNIFAPRSIALIGASNNPQDTGYHVYRNILDNGFAGDLFPLHPTQREIRGNRMYKDIRDIAFPIDLAIVIGPLTPSHIEACVQAHISTLCAIDDQHVISQTNEEAIIRLCARHQIQLISHKGIGFINTHANIFATNISPYALPQKGNLFFISDSPAIATSFLHWFKAHNIGIHTFLSLTNGSNTDILNEGKEGDIVLLYLSSIKNGQQFLSLAREQKLPFPMILCTPQLHHPTQGPIIRAFCTQTNIIHASTIEQACHLSEILSWQPYSKGKNVALVCPFGDMYDLFRTSISQRGLKTAPLRAFTKKILQDTFSSANSYVSVFIDAFCGAVDAACADETADMVLILIPIPLLSHTAHIAKRIAKLAHVHKKPVFVSFPVQLMTEESIQHFHANHIPAFSFPDHAIDAAYNVYMYTKNPSSPSKNTTTISLRAVEKIKRMFIAYEEAHTATLSSMDTENVFRSIGIPTPAQVTPANVHEAISIATRMGFPVQLGLVSPSGKYTKVKKNLYSAKEVHDAFLALERQSPTWDVDPKLNKAILLRKELAQTALFTIHIHKHPEMGYIVTLQAEGSKKTAQQDAVGVMPLGKKDAHMLLERSSFNAYLLEASFATSIDTIEEVLQKLSHLVSYFPSIQEISLDLALDRTNVTATQGEIFLDI